MVACHAEVKNLSRHLGQVHNLHGGEREMYLSAQRQLPRGRPDPTEKPVDPKKINKQCSLCSKSFKRVDAHLVSMHGLKRGSNKYKAILETVCL